MCKTLSFAICKTWNPSFLLSEHSPKDKTKEAEKKKAKEQEREKEKKKHKLTNEIKRENGEVKQPIKGLWKPSCIPSDLWRWSNTSVIG